jgi:hypothetical protein
MYYFLDRGSTIVKKQIYLNALLKALLKVLFRFVFEKTHILLVLWIDATRIIGFPFDDQMILFDFELDIR